MFLFPTLASFDTAFDFAIISCISALLLLSLFSIAFIFHLRFKSRSSLHLQHFNSLWTVRFLLVFFITFWALNELLRLPFFRREYLYPFWPRLTVPQEANLCKVHLVLSLGFFEPGFLVILLFLLDISVKKTSRPRTFFSVFFVLLLCLPLLLLQVYVVFFPRTDIRFPDVFHRTWFLPWHRHEDTTVLCPYPLINTIFFAIFGSVYLLSFLFSFWRVASHVINKALSGRIFALAITVIVTLPVKILLMASSVFWTPDRATFKGIALLMFLSTLASAVVGQGILVIKPIAESLAADAGGGGGAESCRDSNHGERTTPTTSSELRTSEERINSV